MIIDTEEQLLAIFGKPVEVDISLPPDYVFVKTPQGLGIAHVSEQALNPWFIIKNIS
jgi:hypothetical protein